MDSKDRQILRELQGDGRLTNQELSERVNLSPSPCLRRVRLLEEQGVIRGYTALVDQKSWGLPVTVFIRIKLERHGDEAVNAFEQAIISMPQVMDCWLMTGRSDYLLRVIASDLDDYEHFVRRELQRVPGIASIDTSFAYGSVKHAQVLPDA
ncbi:MAG: Lrp/AsnC family transcriptional regulator [Hyphomonas sp.]|jgi:Lrp/AsnC family transcriptional regulator, leucine-responsive regulatory protein|nr:Lrp/AsnC family transcriptional regulator [Hyphomonas sp.]